MPARLRSERREVLSPGGGKKMTKQAPGHGRSVSDIVRSSLGYAPVELRGVGRFGDFASVGTFQDALNTVLKARAQFAQLPAKARERFRNDPVVMLAFVQDPKNLEEAQALGLLKDEKKSPSVPSKQDPAVPPAGAGGTGASGAPAGGAK